VSDSDVVMILSESVARDHAEKVDKASKVTSSNGFPPPLQHRWILLPYTLANLSFPTSRHLHNLVSPLTPKFNSLSNFPGLSRIYYVYVIFSFPAYCRSVNVIDHHFVSSCTEWSKTRRSAKRILCQFQFRSDGITIKHCFFSAS
jgi:hypothetical protein